MNETSFMDSEYNYAQSKSHFIHAVVFMQMEKWLRR